MKEYQHKIFITEELNLPNVLNLIRLAKQFPKDGIYEYENEDVFYCFIFAQNKQEAIQYIRDWKMNIYNLDVDSLELPSLEELNKKIKKL